MAGGKLECFRFQENKKIITKHYTEITKPIKGAGGFQVIVPLGEGQFTCYIFKKHLLSKEVQTYMRTLGSYEDNTYNEQLVKDLYAKYGRRIEIISIFKPRDRIKFTSDFGLGKCPNGIDIPHIKPGSGKQSKTIRTFSVNSSTFHLDINYKTFLCYKSNSDTVSRGKAKLYLYKGNTLIDVILNVDFNDDKTITKTYEGKGIGEYRLVMELEDTYQDTKQIYFEMKSRIRETKTSLGNAGEKDNSKYSLHILDSKGQKVDINGQLDIEMECDGTCKQCIRIEVPKGETYTLNGDFFKPDKAVGGPLGTGAAIELTEGEVKYDLVARKFPLGEHIGGGIGGVPGLLPPNVTIPGWELGSPDIQIPTEGDQGIKQTPFLWLDVIKVESSDVPEVDQGEIDEIIESNICYPLGTELDIDVDGLSMKDFLDHNPELSSSMFFDDEVEMSFKNPTDRDIIVNLNFNVDDNTSECGGGGHIRYFGGKFRYWGYGDLNDGDDYIPTSELKVEINEFLPNHVIVGGHNGSYVEVLVSQGGKVVERHRVEEDLPQNIIIDNLFSYGDNDFEVEIVTHQKGGIDSYGNDLRSNFYLEEFKLNVEFELNSVNFGSKLDFYINNDLEFSSDQIGNGEHYFPVKKGLNRYKYVFSTNLWDYNWDYVEVPWIRLTNWMCGEHIVTPYCDKGRGDKCVEALIGCLLGLLPPIEAKGCIDVTYYDYETGRIIKQYRRYGFTPGHHAIRALEYPEFELVGDVEQVITIDRSGICTPVAFYYRRTHRRCVHVYHMNCETNVILKKVTYNNLAPGRHYFNPISIPYYRARPISPIEFDAINTIIPIECESIFFCYDWVGDKNSYLDCLYVIHREYGNPNNILETENLINLKAGKMIVYAKEIEGYKVKGAKFKEIDIRTITNPLDCLVVDFEYEKIKLDCIIIKFIDRANEKVLDTDFYYGLLPGEYAYFAKKFKDYKLVSEQSYTILLNEEGITDECKELTFLYEPMAKGCALGKKIWLFT